MQLQRRRPVELSSQRVTTVVVMDVLRMTSTAAVLMSRPSCMGVAVAATLEDLERLSQPVSDCVVVSELVGESWPGTWVDNSPARVSRMAFGERTPVLVTTNGTRTLLSAAACADHVLLASFLDLHAVARHIAAMATPCRDEAASSVVLLPAGHFASGEGCIEDDLCADALELLLAGRAPDLAEYSAIIRAHPRVRQRVEAEPGFSADLDLALQGDPGAAVLKFQPRGAGVGHILRA
jgi:phosphosulfolactate phosphohydrolase-like enzyme